MSERSDPAAATVVAHDARHFGDAVVPPIFQTSLFTFPSYEEMAATFSGTLVRPTYSRGLNPTVRAFEEKIAALELTEDALGFGSGMAAISSSVLAFARPGDRILAVEHCYPDTFRFFQTLLKAFGIAVDYVDGSDLAARRGHAAGPAHPLSRKPDELDVPGARSCRACGSPRGQRRDHHRRQQLGFAGLPEPDRARLRSRASTRRPNISAGIPMWLPASSPGAAS